MIKRILTHSFSLMNVDLVLLDSKWNYKNVISPYHRIYYIRSGTGEISHFQKKLRLEPGYLYIIPSFTLCNLSCESFLEQYFVQFFEETSDGKSLFASNRSIFKVEANPVDVLNFERLKLLNPGRGINRSDDPKIYEKNIYYKEYQELNMQQNTNQFLETQGILLQLVARFTSPEIIAQREREHIPVKILDTISYIVMNLQASLSVRYLAERIHLNSEYFSRLFERYTGSRPLAYITEKRIERAQYLIMSSGAKQTEIAKMTGFESLSHFSKTFKKITGMSPRAYSKYFS